MYALIRHPSKEPVGLEEVKHYLRLDHSHDDAMLLDLIASVRQLVELHIGKGLILQTWQYRSLSTKYRNMECFYLEKRPFLAMEKLVLNGETLESSTYHISKNYRGALITFNKEYQVKNLECLFNVGFGEEPSNVPCMIRQAILMLIQGLYENPGQGLIANDFKGIWTLLDPYKTYLLN